MILVFRETDGKTGDRLTIGEASVPDGSTLMRSGRYIVGMPGGAPHAAVTVVDGDAIDLQIGGGSGQVLTADLLYDPNYFAIDGTNHLTASGTLITHDLLSVTHHGDTIPASVVRGDLVTGQGAAPNTFWQRLGLGGAATYLRSDGTDAAWSGIQAGDLPNLGTQNRLVKFGATGLTALTIFHCNAIEADIATIGATNMLLLVSDTQAVADNLTIPANVALDFTEAGKLVPAANKKITINNLVYTGEKQIFDVSAASSTVDLANQNHLYVDWYGMKADSDFYGRGGTDNSPIFQKIITMAYANKISEIEFGYGNYGFVTPVTLGACNHQLKIYGQGEVTSYYNDYGTTLGYTNGQVVNGSAGFFIDDTVNGACNHWFDKLKMISGWSQFFRIRGQLDKFTVTNFGGNAMGSFIDCDVVGFSQIQIKNGYVICNEAYNSGIHFTSSSNNWQTIIEDIQFYGGATNPDYVLTVGTSGGHGSYGPFIHNCLFETVAAGIKITNQWQWQLSYLTFDDPPVAGITSPMIEIVDNATVGPGIAKSGYGTIRNSFVRCSDDGSPPDVRFTPLAGYSHSPITIEESYIAYLENNGIDIVNVGSDIANVQGTIPIVSTLKNDLHLQVNGTIKTVYDVLKITNYVNAADMDGTGSGILFNQYYYDASTPAIINSGRISVITESDWTSTASTQDSSMLFSTALNGVVGEKARLTSGGYFGINCTPAYHLDVNGDALIRNANMLIMGASGSQKYTGLFSDVSQNDLSIVTYRDIYLNTDTNSSGVGTNRLAIKGSTGFVGINHSSPAALLDIKDGSLYFTDSDCAHGVTTYLPTDVYGSIHAASATDGGLDILGISDTDNYGLSLQGMVGDNTPALAPVRLVAMKKNGTGAQDLEYSELAYSFTNRGRQVASIYGEGNLNLYNIAVDATSDILTFWKERNGYADITPGDIVGAIDFQAMLSSTYTKIASIEAQYINVGGEDFNHSLLNFYAYGFSGLDRIMYLNGADESVNITYDLYVGRNGYFVGDVEIDGDIFMYGYITALSYVTTPTVYVDHIAEHTTSHGIVFDHNMSSVNKNLSSGTIDLADDNATSFTPGRTHGIMLMSCQNTSIGVVVGYEVGATPSITIIAQNGTSFEVTTGALAGTTGSDAKFTLSTHTDGKIYLENRLGGT